MVSLKDASTLCVNWNDTIKAHTLDKNRVKEMLRKWQTNTQRNSNDRGVKTVSKIKLLLDVVGNLRSLADSVQAVTEVMAGNEPAKTAQPETPVPAKETKQSEGYPDPTAAEALTNMEREEKAKTWKPCVFICSPYAGNIRRNTEQARQYMKFAVRMGAIPFAPHLLYPQALDESDPAQRELGLFFGSVWLGKCDELWVFGSNIYIAAHPLCERCGKHGRITPAQEVHHIQPLSQGGTNDYANLMALCTSCHSEITAREGERWKKTARMQCSKGLMMED
ncbi:MAG: HNH endonuclease [Pelotomaculum sp. PtaU1.Bin035]|nr:MAG: HNH endonuclease [Pelotomaculum sp. PtaU1.Bin035]